jgi:hypothetical protein
MKPDNMYFDQPTQVRPTFLGVMFGRRPYFTKRALLNTNNGYSMKNKNGLPTILSPSIIFLYVAVAASAFIFFRLHRHGGSKLILLFPLEISSYSK